MHELYFRPSIVRFSNGVNILAQFNEILYTGAMRIKVRVTPKAKKERFEKTGENQFTAAVKERAERSEANDRVQVLVAQHFNVPVTSVKFLTGMRARTKLFEVVQ